jgi:hypothetical protein
MINHLVPIGVGTAVAAAFGGLIYLAYQDHKAWEQFRVDHNCYVVAKISGSTGLGNTITGNGNVGITTITVPGKTGWLCDDGITYYR